MLSKWFYWWCYGWVLSGFLSNFIGNVMCGFYVVSQVILLMVSVCSTLCHNPTLKECEDDTHIREMGI